MPENRDTSQNRYLDIIKWVFRRNFKDGSTDICFARSELVEAARDLLPDFWATRSEKLLGYEGAPFSNTRLTQRVGDHFFFGLNTVATMPSSWLQRSSQARTLGNES